MKLLFILVVFSGCQTLDSGSSSKETKVDSELKGESSVNQQSENKSESNNLGTTHKKPADFRKSLDEMAHKQALMWARISDLEDQLTDEKAKVELLQKKQRTGLDFKPKRKILVEKLVEKEEEEEVFKVEKPKKEQVKPIAKEKNDDYAVIEKNIANEAAELEKKKLAKKDAVEKRNNALARAQDLYRTGSFGASIAELESAVKNYDDNEDGICSFWIARNWMSLKEFQTSATKLEDFTKKFPLSSYLGRAKLELARSQNQLGLRSKALQSYEEVIKKYPGQESAEMAQLEIEKLKRTL